MRGNLPGYDLEIDKKINDKSDDESLLTDVNHTCPVCGCSFRSKSPRMSKLTSDGFDEDLRPKFKSLDITKYQVVECPLCGFADMSKFFAHPDSLEIVNIKSQGVIQKKGVSTIEGTRDYETAYGHYRSAMRCTIASKCKKGKSAYIALCTAWLVRGWREHEFSTGRRVCASEPMSENEEKKLLSLAVKRFKEAESMESFPICGISESTYDQIMAAELYKLGEIQDASKYIVRVLGRKDINANYRVLAEDLRHKIKRKLESKH